jgi:hypothetical protein
MGRNRRWKKGIFAHHDSLRQDNKGTVLVWAFSLQIFAGLWQQRHDLRSASPALVNRDIYHLSGTSGLLDGQPPVNRP